MRVLVVSNMRADADSPQRGSFVRDQVDALRRAGVEVVHYAWPPGRGSYLPAIRRIRRILRRDRYDLVHAHYGLAGWCASLAGADPLVVTFHGTDVRHPLVGRLSRMLLGRIDLVAAASRSLFTPAAGRPGLAPAPGRAAVLPCGADLERFRPMPRGEARRRLGLEPDGRYLLFPAAPNRPEKRHDRALELARACDAELLTVGSVRPERMPEWINAAAAVLITSDYEGFGLAAVEGLACGVPVLSTPVGIAPALLGGLEGCLVAPYETRRWSATARGHLDAPDPRTDPRARLGWIGSKRSAERVVEAYRAVIGER